jgi:hypothetical protein
MTDYERKEIQEAIKAADNALHHLHVAKKRLNSAGTWGWFDILGGNFITGLVKHSKMSKAKREFDAARYALQQFSKELQDVSGYDQLQIGDFLTFADFFFDGFIIDIMVQSKISDAKAQCNSAIKRVSAIRKELKAKL